MAPQLQCIANILQDLTSGNCNLNLKTRMYQQIKNKILIYISYKTKLLPQFVVFNYNIIRTVGFSLELKQNSHCQRNYTKTETMNKLIEICLN